MRFIWIIVGFAVANFLWALLFGQNWGEASKISFFQASAIAYVWFFGVHA